MNSDDGCRHELIVFFCHTVVPYFYLVVTFYRELQATNGDDAIGEAVGIDFNAWCHTQKADGRRGFPYDRVRNAEA